MITARHPNEAELGSYKRLSTSEDFPIVGYLEINEQLFEFQVPVYFSLFEDEANRKLELQEEDVRNALQTQMFTEWRDTIAQNDRLIVTAIIIRSIIKEEGAIKYLYVDSKAFSKPHYRKWWEENRQDEFLELLRNKDRAKAGAMLPAVPGIAFMKGATIAALIVISVEGEEYTVFSVQPRVAVAEIKVPEIPSGTISNTGEFCGAAAKSLEDKLNMKLNLGNMVDLTQLAFGDAHPGVYPSAGGCDEYVKLFLYRHDGVSKETIKNWKRDHTGRQSADGVALRVCLLSDLWRESPDGKSLSALAIFTRLRRCGMLA